MAKCRRIFAVIITLAMAVTMSFSALFIIAEADHNCSGDDCHICQQISICSNLFKSIFSASGTIAIAVAAVFFVILTIGIVEYISALSNLVQLKVKLSN